MVLLAVIILERQSFHGGYRYTSLMSFFQSVAIVAQHHPVGGYDIFYMTLLVINLCLLWLMILLFLLTYHLSMLTKSYRPRPVIISIFKGGCQ